MVKTSPSDAGHEYVVPGWGTKISHALQPQHQNIKQQKPCCNKFNEYFERIKKKLNK